MNTTTQFLRRHALAIIALCVAGTAFQCIDKPLSPIFPTYETELSVTLIDFQRSLEDLMSKDTTTVHRDNFGGYYFADVQAGQPTKIDTIKVQPSPSSAQVALDTFQVAAVPSANFGFGASTFGMPTGTSIPFWPGGGTTIPGGALDFSNDFEFLAVQRGTLTLTVRNTFPVTVKFQRPIRLKNNSTSPSDTTTIAVFALDSLVQGQSKSVTSDLALKFVYGSLKTDSLSFGTSPRPDSFTVASSDSLVFTFSSSAITVDSARAVIPPQLIASIDDSVITIDSTVVLQNASFSRGQFTARIVNNLDINVRILLQFDNFKNPNPPFNVLRIDRILLPRETFNFPVNLDTVNIVNPTPAAVGTNMKFSVAIQSINSGGQKSTVSSTDFVRAEFLPQGYFALKSVTGIIDSIPMPIFSGSSGPDVGEAAEKFSGRFTFDSVRIAVRLALTGGFKTNYNLMLEARNRKTGAIDSIALPPPLGQTTRSFNPSAGPVTIELGNSQGLSTFLQKFVPNFPDTFIVRGSVTVNPDVESGTIYDTTKLYQDVTVYFPLKFGLSGGLMEEYASLDTGGTFPKEFVRNVRQSSLRFSITNHLPVQLGFSARLLGQLTPGGGRGTILRIPTDSTTRIIAAPPVDLGGSVTGPVISTFVLSLTDQEVAKFNQADTMYIRLDMQSTGNGVQAVRFRATDYVRVRVAGTMRYIVNRQD